MTGSATTLTRSSRASAIQSKCSISTRTWYAYANFHEFYDGYHGISSDYPTRPGNAITFVTQSTHKLLAAWSQASMIHIQHAENRRLDMARFNDAFMMHTSTSPQYGIIASCDVAAAMMEQPAGRALVQETIDEALGFRRAMASVRSQLKGSWWFKFLSSRRIEIEKTGLYSFLILFSMGVTTGKWSTLVTELIPVVRRM
jgi:arginine/lysine/ornithine decarboxylase